jgi:hypothetical protein
MHTKGSWSISENLGRSLVLALYVRDALGLVDASPVAVPPLVPAVPLAESVEGDVRSWRAWLALLLADGATDDALGPLLAPLELVPAVTALRADAEAWCAERKTEHIDRFQRQTREQRLAITRLVAEVERDLGRRAAQFTFTITTVPVAGFWEHRARHDLLVMSDASRNDLTRLRSVLTPIVRELA